MGARTKQLTGWIKQAAGRLVGDRSLERKGRRERRSGEVVQRVEKTIDKVERVIDGSAEAVKDAVRPDRNGRRRP